MNYGPIDLDTGMTALDLIDHQNVDWKRVHRTAYLIHQHLRYEYPGPIYDLKQQLIIVPPELYDNQRRVVHRLEVSAPHFTSSTQQDEFGNVVLNIFVPEVEKAIDFEAWIVVERQAEDKPHLVASSWLSDSRLLTPSRLTQPDEALREVASALQAERLQGEDLARRINDWVYHTLTYEHDITSIRTSAAEALALRKGVCQDYAHIMLALCRLCGLPARYVSGHMLGEGGTHAWVEVVLPSSAQTDMAMLLPLDPTHGREAGLSYITIAVGRDYLDVAPTSGTYRSSYQGQLSARKRVGLTVLEYADTSERP